MARILKTPVRLAGILLVAGIAGWAQGGNMGQPGAINYTEGQVFVNGQAATASQSARVQPGQTLETQNGKAEMLLTPGVFVRLNDHSQARLESNSLTDTRVNLLKGEAMVEADQVVKDNGIRILDSGYTTLIDKPGIYDFNAIQPALRVYDGEATVNFNDQSAKVKKGHEIELVASNAKLKTHGFDTKTTDSLYAWSRLRSEYMAEANMSSAQTIVVTNPWWYYGTGWYWNPYWASWAFVPGYGYWGSPFGFGWGFYSPVIWPVYRPIVGYHPFVPGISAVPFRGAVPAFRSAAPAFRGGFGGGMAFHGGFAGGHAGAGGRR